MNNVVFFVVDRKYQALALANAAALLRQPSRNFDVVVFYEDTDPIAFQVPPGVEILRADLTSKLPVELIGSALFPRVVWARLFAPYLLRERGYRRGLYCDADVSVFAPVSGLFDLDLGGAPYAAVADWIQIFADIEQKGANHIKAAGVTDGRYANSGVLLFEFEAWCRRDIVNLARNYCATHKPLYPEQDFINHAFQGQWLELSQRWNFFSFMMTYGVEGALKPAIYHYIAPNRPWSSTGMQLDAVHFEYFDENLAAIGAPFRVRDLQPPRTLGQRVKFAYKNAVYNTVVGASRKRRHYEMWTRRIEAFVNRLDRGLAQGRFIDAAQGLSTMNFSPAARHRLPGFHDTDWRDGYIVARERLPARC